VASKCVLSERFAANLQPILGLIESEYRRTRYTMDVLTEAFLRQAHDALGKLAEMHVPSSEGRST
jgi:hypothetical protein